MRARRESEQTGTSTFAPLAVSGVLFVVGTLFGATATAGVLTPTEAVGMSALTFVAAVLAILRVPLLAAVAAAVVVTALLRAVT